ncbi:response regulator transcription factor [Streptomyces sp. NPDC091279]|uniref:helix-turn-helix transcriptional regulator n=1 Tax=Streptomyces sp. NPDC091279 TaxID=3365983 RepID=UPI0037F3EDC6
MLLSGGLVDAREKERHYHSCETQDVLKHSVSKWMAGSAEGAVQWAMRAVLQGCRIDSGCYWAEASTTWLSALFSGLRDAESAESLIREARRRIESSRNKELQNSLMLMQAYSRYCQGRQAQASVLAATGLAALEEQSVSQTVAFGVAVMAVSAFRRADIREASRCDEQLQENLLINHYCFAYGPVVWTHLQLIEAKHGAARAAALARQFSAPGPGRTALLLSEPAAASWLVRLLLKENNRTAAEAVTAAAEEFAALSPRFPSLTAAAHHARGLLDADVEQLRDAVCQHRDTWAKASALEDLAVLLAQRGQPDHQLTETLERAAEAYESAQASRDCARVKRRMRTSGRARRHVRWRDGRTDEPQNPAGELGLTESEHKVASLVAQGFTNAQVAHQLFLSKHTVAFHLRKIFKKLDVESRAELMCMWHENSRRTA